MLVVSRKKDEKIIVAGEIEITILEIGRNRVRFGIKAPKNIQIQTHTKTTPDETSLRELESMVGLNSSESAPEHHVLSGVAGMSRDRWFHWNYANKKRALGASVGLRGLDFGEGIHYKLPDRSILS